jgi:hypothetical protein
MWKILKTEIDYNKRAFTLAFIIGILVLTTAGVISLNESERAGSALFTTSFLFVVMVVYLFLLIHLGLILVLNLAIVWLELFGYRDTVLRFIFGPYTTPGGATVYTAIAIGMFYLSAGIFTRRKVYLA